MKIEDSRIELDASHRAQRHHDVRESLRAWVGERRPDFEGRGRAAATTPPARVSISDLARAAQARASEDIEHEDGEGETLDVAMTVLRALTEMLTGRRVEVFDPRELERAKSRHHADDGRERPPAATPRAGFGIEYERVERVVEEEQARFSARGEVSTADGRKISFSIDLTLERRFVSEERLSLRAGDALLEDPLVLNFDGSGARLGGERVRFDINADGQADDIAQLAAGSGYLALDRNDNGQIDDGSELFGARTGNGFAELAAHDEDGNGWIDEADPVFEHLSVWRPGSAPVSLAAVGVGALHLASAATPFALRGAANESLGALRSSGFYLKEDGSAGLLQQIDIAV